MKNTLVLGILALAAAVFPSICIAQENGKTNTSIAMLHYLATETRLINTEKNNRIMLEETYNKLINNTNPGIVDETTQDFLQVMLDDIENFRISSVQRERLQYILENQRAQAITQAMPNPLYLLGLTAPGGTTTKSSGWSKSFNFSASANVNAHAFVGPASLSGSGSSALNYAKSSFANVAQTIMNPWKLIGTLSVMTLDSVFKYQQALDDADMSFLKENWQLDDTESATLHNLRSQTFNYMIYIARANKLEAADTLNEESIDNFVKICADTNFERRRQSLEDNRLLYEKYAPYYLELAKTYYELEQYQECVDAVDTYGAVKAAIFRKDRDYAQVLPKAVIAAAYVYDLDENYAGIAAQYLDELIKNTSGKDWELRYFAAQSYMNMAAVAETRENLARAYTILLENVTHLSKQQEQYLADYIAPVKENVDKVKTKAQKKQSEKTIKELKKARETELPPLSQPLVVNYEALRLLMDELEISAQERQRIHTIVKDAFINPAFFNAYFPDKKTYQAGEITFERKNITGKDIVLPVVFILILLVSFVNLIAGLLESETTWGGFLWLKEIVTAAPNWGKAIVCALLIAGNIFSFRYFISSKSPIKNTTEWKGIKFNLPAGFLSKDSAVNFAILANEDIAGEGTEYAIKKVDRNKRDNIDKFKVYSVLKPSQPFTVKRNLEYVCKLTITTLDVPQTLLFSCPIGKIDFTYQGMENANVEVLPEAAAEPETAAEINQTAEPAVHEPAKDGV
ncbi:MAG: hypothetical protein Pg6C_14220 [Treponemataceae bacterium]|nr:MAG: hypothetical protein Pg6C_14220 [Treponemataceae bacterium]